MHYRSDIFINWLSVSAQAMSMPKNYMVKSTSDMAGEAIVRAASIFSVSGRKFDHPSRKINLRINYIFDFQIL